MKDSKEIRANGAVITKTQREGSIAQYHVEGSENGPWDIITLGPERVAQTVPTFTPPLSLPS